MIPTRLILRNFLPYRGEVTLDLRTVRVACIAGDNGAGKSSLLDAITWALWGKARGAAERDLMTLGTTEMGVDFHFLLGAQEYRVLRRRRRRGSSQDVAQLEVQLRDLTDDDNGPWRAITGDTLQQTQRLLTAAIGMEYDTFINSAFILQGRADEFTTKGPTDRKQVLADILGLGRYDALEERARALRREQEQRRREAEARLEQIEVALRARPGVEAELQAVATALIALGAEIADLGAALDEVRARRADLERRAQEAHAAEERQREHGQEADRLRARIAATAARIATHEAIIADADAIAAGHARLQEAQGREAAANAALARLNELHQQQRLAEGAITNARTLRLQEFHALEHQIGDLTEQQARIPELERQYADLEGKIAAVRTAEERQPILTESVNSATEEIGGRKAENEYLSKEMKRLKALQEQIDTAGAECPLCRRPLAGHDREQIHDQYQRDGLALKDQYLANRQRIADLEREIADCNAQLAEATRLIRTGRSLGQVEGNLRAQLTNAREAGVRVLGVMRDRDDLARILERRDYAHEAHAELAAVIAEIAEVAYDQEEHRRTSALVRELHPFEQRRHDLVAAERAIPEERERLAEDQSTLRLHERARDEAAALALSLRASSAELPDLILRTEDLESALALKRRDEVEGLRRQGSLERQLADLADREDEARALRQERAALVEAEGAYRDLARAFGKSGIQAMIIEAAVPELQDEANAILANMPGNSMRVEFHTQRTTQKGDTVEALEIIIGDEAGQRSYAMYSGGEAFRINFAIRVALAKLLARRAGAKLQMLVIDEGFGTQDARGRDSLVEAIRSVEGDFQSILVITHVNELKELFPTQILVEKGPAGSQITVT